MADSQTYGLRTDFLLHYYYFYMHYCYLSLPFGNDVPFNPVICITFLNKMFEPINYVTMSKQATTREIKQASFFLFCFLAYDWLIEVKPSSSYLLISVQNSLCKEIMQFAKLPAICSCNKSTMLF